MNGEMHMPRNATFDAVMRGGLPHAGDLPGFIRTRIAEWEAVAAAATPGPWAEPYFTDERESPGDGGWWIHNGQAGTAEYAVAVTVPYNPRAEADAAHVALHDPASVLADMDMLRSVVAFLDPPDAPLDKARFVAEATLVLLAQRWRDHPEFRPEWKVE